LGGALGAAGFGRASKRAITEGEPRGADMAKKAAKASNGDPDNPCREQIERWRRDLDIIASQIGGSSYIGSFRGNPWVAMINPNGQSYEQITHKLKSIGFSFYPNVHPSHWGGSDWSGKGSSGIFFHITVGYPSQRVQLDGGDNNNVTIPNYSTPPAWITADARCVDPSGWRHIKWTLFGR
jgi:hypothetical protein